MLTPIKIIHSYPVWLPQTQTWMYNQVRYLPQEVENHIVCERTENLDQFCLPNIHSLAKESLLRYVWEKALQKIGFKYYLDFLVSQAQQHKVNIIHSHFGHTGWRNLGAVRKTKLFHIVSFYGIDVSYLPTQQHYWYERYKNLFKEVNVVLCEGPYMAQSLVDLGCPSHKVQVHPLGIDLEKFVYQPRTWNRSEPLNVLIAASFREKKGITYALEALGQLQEHCPIQITIIGDASSMARSVSEKQKIIATIEKYKLNSKARLLGYQPHNILLEEAYKHHIFLSPSVTASDGDTEGGAPVSIIEMAATGMPIVSSFHCDIPQVIQHRVTGLLAPERDVDRLVQHLKWLVEYPDKWGDMTQQGRQRVEQKFNAKVQGGNLAQIYRSLIKA